MRIWVGALQMLKTSAPTYALVAGLAVAATTEATSEAAEPYTPGLVEFMMHVQSHHAKLWLAGNARNWDLADYQVDELKELIEDIAKRIPEYKGTPVGKMIESTTMPPIGEIEGAIKARDSGKFAAAFDRLTAACNVCHEGRHFQISHLLRERNSAHSRV